MTKKSLNIKKIAGQCPSVDVGADMYSFAVPRWRCFFGFGVGGG